MSQRLIIVDCDCGVDDALAILLALAQKKTWKLLAVTCCHGNTTIENVCDNVRKVLQLCNEIKIPVYRGCKGPFVKNAELKIFHGKDGLGNVAHAYPHDEIQIADDHAVNALVHIAKTYRQEGIHLVVLGPMTNIAMAHRLDPEFTKNLKSIYFMGGNIHGVGNVTSAAEFNFACDPEAAHIIVTESICPVTMIPWETTIRHGMSWEFYEKLVNARTTISKFIKDTSKILAHECKSDNLTFVDCDFMAVASLVSPRCIKTVEKHPISVETTGRVTSGQVVIERFYHAKATPKILNIVTEFHDSVLNDLRKQIVHEKQKSEI